MQEPLWQQQPRDLVAAVSTPSNRLGWLWIAVAVCSALLLVGWPLPRGASGDSTPNARAFQLFPGAFVDSTTSTNGVDAALASSAATEERSRPTIPAEADELADTRDLFAQQRTAASPPSQPAAIITVPVPSAPESVLQNTVQTNVAPPAAPPAVVSAPAVEPVVEPTVEPSESLAGAPPPVVAVADTASLPFSVREFGLFDAMNEARIANGLPALIAKDVLTEVARARSEEMTRLDYFAHFYAGGTSAYEFLQRAGARFSTAGENLAKVGGDEVDSVELAINALMASTTHRENILNPRFVRVGVGAVTSDEGITIFTMIYADR